MASNKVEGRRIPLVLLMHVGALDARMLPRLLGFYRAQGVRFVSLAEAERDPFYAGDIAPATARRPATLEAAPRSEEHTSELQSLTRISYAVLCLKKHNTPPPTRPTLTPPTSPPTPHTR